LQAVPGTTWKFWGWQPTAGLTKELGKARLRHIEFVTPPAADFFAAPPDFTKG
jgi:hypothetical protein